MSAERPPQCAEGDQALARGAWTQAREAYEAALRSCELPEALEGLGQAAWWLDLADLVFESRSRAYGLYLARGDLRAAARVAVWRAWDHWAFRGESVVANGFLQRARRLLEDQCECPERAWLEIREASLSLMGNGDPEQAHTLAQKVFASRKRRQIRIWRCWADQCKALHSSRVIEHAKTALAD